MSEESTQISNDEDDSASASVEITPDKLDPDSVDLDSPIETPIAERRDHPMNHISEPGPNDCLFGRGGGTNHHPGNKLYRKMVEDRKETYLKSKRLDKPLVAMEIIQSWRDLDPPGRFLKQDEVTKLWSDVGDKKAREKTSQALREKTVKGCFDAEDEVGLNDPLFESRIGHNVKRVDLKRDHSLGTEVMDGKESYSMEGFSWDDTEENAVSPPLQQEYHQAEPAANQPSRDPYNMPAYYPPAPHYGSPPPPGPPSHHYPPHHSRRHHSNGPSHRGRHHNHSLSMNPLPGASTKKISSSSFDDEGAWGHPMGYDGRVMPPPPPSYYGYPPPPHSWGSPPPHHYPPYGRPAPQSAFYRYDSLDEHYYGQNVMGASPQDFTKIADLMCDDDDKSRNSRSSSQNNPVERSNTWAGHEAKYRMDRDTSIGSFAPYDAPIEDEDPSFDETAIARSRSMPKPSPPPIRNDNFPSPPHPVQHRVRPVPKEKEISPVEKRVTQPSLIRKLSGGAMYSYGPPIPAPDVTCRPEPVKRDTSNQPESMETKRSIKRVVLSRDKSAISRGLKEDQRKGVSSKLSRAELLDRSLSVEINKLGLGDRPSYLGRMTTEDVLNSLIDDTFEIPLIQPQPLSEQDRLPTIDSIEMSMVSGYRSQSCEMEDALALILEDDPTEDAPSAVNEDIAAKWIKGESGGEE